MPSHTTHLLPWKVPLIHFRLSTALIVVCILSAHPCLATLSQCLFGITNCTNDTFCDRIENRCKQKYFSRCANSAECGMGDHGECVSILSNGTLSRCTSMSSTTSQKQCFCAPRSSDHYDEGCSLNTVRLHTSFDQAEYCVPCTFLNESEVALEEGVCEKVYKFQSPPDGQSPSNFQACHASHICNENLSCCGLNTAGYHSSCEIVSSNASAAVGCHCSSYLFSPCLTFSSCEIGFSCVRLPLSFREVCIAAEYRSRVDPPFQTVPSLLKSVFIATGTLQLVFILFRSVAFLKSGKHFLRLGLVFFIVESMLGFSLTAIHAFVLIDYNSEKQFDQIYFWSFDPRMAISSAVLFVITQAFVVVSGYVFIRRQLMDQDDNITYNRQRFRFSLVRQIVTKLGLMGSFLGVSITGLVSVRSLPIGHRAIMACIALVVIVNLLFSVLLLAVRHSNCNISSSPAGIDSCELIVDSR